MHLQAPPKQTSSGLESWFWVSLRVGSMLCNKPGHPSLGRSTAVFTCILEEPRFQPFPGRCLECNVGHCLFIHSFIKRASSVFLDAPCLPPLRVNCGRISSHLSGHAASAPGSSPAPLASSSATGRSKWISGDYLWTQVKEWARQQRKRTSSSFSKISLSLSGLLASGRGKSVSLMSWCFSSKLQPTTTQIQRGTESTWALTSARLSEAFS